MSSENTLLPAENVKTSLEPPPASPLKKSPLRFAPYCSPNEFLPPPLEGFAYACIDDRLYIFGGSNLEGREMGDLYMFSLKGGWCLVQPPEEQKGGDEQQQYKPSPRVAATMTAYNNKLYVFGGVNEKEGWLNDFYEFDTESQKWTRLLNVDRQPPNAPSPRDKCSLVTARGKLYLYGGFGPRTTTTTNKENGTKTKEADDNTIAHPAENNENVTTGQIAAHNGGKTEDKSGGEVSLEDAEKAQRAAEFAYFDDFWCFDPSDGNWSPVEIDCTTNSPTNADGEKAPSVAAPPGLAAYNVCTLADKLLYFGGKTSNGERTNVVYCFALGLKKWLPLHIRDDFCWPAGRSFHSSFVVNDRYLVTFGGRDGDDWERDDLWMLDTSTSQWLIAECEGFGGVSTPCARYGHAMVVLPDADSRQNVVIYGGSAELDPASGVAQDVLTDMYVAPFGEFLQASAPALVQSTNEATTTKETKHQHHNLHFHRPPSGGNDEEPGNGGDESNDEPPATKVPRCDDCIDL